MFVSFYLNKKNRHQVIKIIPKDNDTKNLEVILFHFMFKTFLKRKIPPGDISSQHAK